MSASQAAASAVEGDRCDGPYGRFVNAPAQRRLGLESLEAATALLQRVRGSDPVVGEFEAADLQWWWRTPRSTDGVPDLFWFDSDGLPRAAVVATAWEDSVGLDVIALPGESPDWLGHLVRSGLQHAEAAQLGPVDFVVDRADSSLLDTLAGHGFDRVEVETVQAWMAIADRPAVSRLQPHYRLTDRVATASAAHHLVARNGPEVEHRLRQTSLYRADLDLLILDSGGQVAAYGLFWFDPVTHTGLVEPMRTEDGHQRRGLARHLLTAGVERLARAGAQRIKISHRPDNPAAGHLCHSVGFVPVKETVVVTSP